MANGGKKTAGNSEMAAREQPKSLAIAAGGIVTGNDFAGFMSALMCDLIDGRISPGIGNAACNAGSKLLKVVEMQMKYGTQSATSGSKVLVLAMGQPEPVAAD